MNGAKVLIQFVGDTKDVNNKVSGLSKSMGGLTKSFVAGNLISKGISTAFNMISSSAGGAIKRLDTMNNFPKVMENLGISTKESEEAINTLSDKLQGLPTSIDTAAASVQRFTSKNGNIKKSTDLFLAMNNAILAGGAPAEQQASAMEQLSQAYAKGKPDMMEWRSIQSVMPAQLKQVAAAMGYAGGNADKLGEDLRSGKVSMDDFMNAITDLNKNGSKGFKSFEEQARASTGGIQTAIANMKTAITRGLANAFDTLDKSLQDAGLGGVAGVITSIGKAFENVLKFVTPLITPLATVIKLFTGAGGSVEDAVDNITKSVKGITSTITKIVDKAIKIIEQVLPKIIQLIVTLIPKIIPVLMNALVRIITSLANALPTLIPVLIQGVLSMISALVSALPQIIPPLIQGLMAVLMGVIDMLPQIIPALINGVIQLATAVMKALPQIITMLITALMKCLPQLIQGSIKLVMGLVKALPQIIQSLVKQAPYIVKQVVIGLILASVEMVKAGKSMITQLWNGFKSGVAGFFAKVVSFAKSIPAKIKAALGKVGEIGLDIVKGIGNGITSGTQWIKNKITEFVGNVKSFLKKLFGIKSPSKWARVTIGGNIVLGIAAGLKDKKTQIKQAISNLSTDIQKQLKGKNTNYTKIGKLLGQEFISGIEESLKEIRSVADKFKETLSKVDLWSDNKLTDLSVVKQQINDYSNNLNKLKNKIPASLYSTIMEMDREQGLAYTNKLLNLDSAALKTYVNNWNAIQSESSKLANQWYETEAQKQVKTLTNKYSQTLQQEFKSINKLMGGLGKKATQGLISGLLSQSKDLKGASKTISNNIVNSLKKALKIKSPSRVMMGLGKYTTEGFIQGMQSMTGELDKAMANTFSLSPTLTGTASTHLSPNINNTTIVNVKQDPLGQMVKDIKTFSGGAKNDYNYGLGA